MSNKQTEALKLALENSHKSMLMPGWTLVRNEDFAAIREALADHIVDANKMAEQPAQQAQQAAIKTLEALGYTYHGAELWKPPLGKPAQQQKPSDRFKDFPINGRGEPIIYDTNKIDEIALLLTGDEGEEDSVTVLHKLVRYLNAVHPGKTMTQVLIETEKAALAAQQWNPNDHYKDGWRDGMLTAQQEPVAWMYVNKSTHETKFQKHMRDFVDHSLWSEVPLYGEPLANHELQCVCGAVWMGDEMVHLPDKRPPASKPWVGLTQQDINIAFDDTQEGGGFDDFAHAIEDKLREKNQ